jgi:hypothetical protein
MTIIFNICSSIALIAMTSLLVMLAIAGAVYLLDFIREVFCNEDNN